MGEFRLRCRSAKEGERSHSAYLPFGSLGEGTEDLFHWQEFERWFDPPTGEVLNTTTMKTILILTVSAAALALAGCKTTEASACPSCGKVGCTNCAVDG